MTTDDKLSEANAEIAELRREVHAFRSAMRDTLTLLHGQQGMYWNDARRAELARIALAIDVKIDEPPALPPA